jgi:hypothetical protein
MLPLKVSSAAGALRGIDIFVTLYSRTTMGEPKEDGVDNVKSETSLSDALSSLSLTTELDSALLNHLNLLDQYLFHMECVSQLLRMVHVLRSVSYLGVLRFGSCQQRSISFR